MSKIGAVHARIDAELKASAESVLCDIGLSPTDAIKVFYKQIVFNQGLPFKLAKPRFGKEIDDAVSKL